MRIFLSTLFLTVLIGSSALAQGIDFFHGTWEEALAKAEQEQKIIFIDAYATWCGPCKRMAKTVFTDDKVADFYNATFINMKIDMEKPEGRAFQKKYPVAAFPTLYYIDAKGEVVHRQKGAQQVDGFISLGKKVLGMVDYSKDFDQEYEAGKRDPQFVYDYVKALNKSQKSSLKVSNDYLRDQEDLTTPFNLKFILEATTEADSRIFDLLVENKDAIIKLEGKDAVEGKIAAACHKTMAKAVSFQSEALLEEAITKTEKNLTDGGDDLINKGKLSFYASTKNADEYGKTCKALAKRDLKNDPDGLLELTRGLLENFKNHEDCVKLAQKLAKQAAAKSDNYQHHLSYAMVLLQGGKKEEALKAAHKSHELAKSQGRKAEQQVEQVIGRIEG